MSRAEQILKQIKTLSTNTPDLEAAAVIDNDGLMIASALPSDVDEDSVAAMSAALLGMGERASSELRRGEFEMTMIRGAEGYLLLVRCGNDAVLAVQAGRNAKLGLIFLDVSRTAKEIGRLLA
ncbi:MAG: roadblock/LC7 domain-containing protein [Alphaproteobacteria bacterium]|nr:roadblock/LC7 domain-containing protein [Alphaproteobacteria bacterium]